MTGEDKQVIKDITALNKECFLLATTIGKILPAPLCIYYTSRENTLILLDESHVSRLLATCVSVGSLTAVTI